MNLNPQILIIEDEKNIAMYIASILKGASYRCEVATSGICGLNLVASLCPDMILLDLGLPDIYGLEIIEKIKSFSDIPIIVISARTKESEKVKALDLGADDYITKPFGSAELLARIRACLRHHQKTTRSCPVYTHLNLTVDTDKRLVLLNGEPVHLTQIEYKLLCLLSENAGKVMTYSSIIEKIWGPFMDDNNQILRVNMANIRRKIEDNPAQPVHVFTEIGVGYRMAEGEME
ncbi:MAG: response regulator [Lachnospiraceae bacterium]